MLKKGTVIKCTGCEKKLYKLSRDVKEGDEILAELMLPFEGVPKPRNKVDDCICPYCKFPIVKMCFSTEEGWM